MAPRRSKKNRNFSWGLRPQTPNPGEVCLQDEVRSLYQRRRHQSRFAAKARRHHWARHAKLTGVQGAPAPCLYPFTHFNEEIYATTSARCLASAIATTIRVPGTSLPGAVRKVSRFAVVQVSPDFFSAEE